MGCSKGGRQSSVQTLFVERNPWSSYAQPSVSMDGAGHAPRTAAMRKVEREVPSIQKLRRGLLALVFSCASCGGAGAALDAKIEVIDPHRTWLEGERWGVFVKVTNTGTEPSPLLFHPGNTESEEVFIEAEFGIVADPEDPHPPAHLRPLPRVEDADWDAVEVWARHHGALKLRPGETFVYGPEAFLLTGALYALSSREMDSYRVHLLIGTGSGSPRASSNGGSWSIARRGSANRWRRFHSGGWRGSRRQ